VFRKEFRQLLRWLEFVRLNAPNGDTRTTNTLGEFRLGQIQGAPSLAQPITKRRRVFSLIRRPLPGGLSVMGRIHFVSLFVSKMALRRRAACGEMKFT